jgi:flavin reductase (DIM6/NTAB) family NADH-FMN oxidoreductase RutF
VANDLESSARPAPAPTVSGGRLREALSRVAASVHVVTTDGIAGRCGFTATAFAPVSDDPPTVLVCLARRSPQNPAFRANGVFCVNALGHGDTALADVFAGRAGLHMAERFVHGTWTTLETGAPALDTARVALDCRLVEAVDAATHTILIGSVVGVAMGERRPGLVYADRGYRTL